MGESLVVQGKGTMHEPPPRPVPRPFTMHWGKGQVVEEATFAGQYHEPSVQLLEFEDGSQTIRFCYYSEGRFQRSPLMLGEAEIEALRAQLQGCPRLLGLLRQLVREPR